LIALRPQICAK
jgi:cytidine deaminase